MTNKRRLSLLVLCAGLLLIVVDVTIVSGALSSIPRKLGLSESGLAWVVVAHLVAFAVFLPPIEDATVGSPWPAPEKTSARS